MSLRDLGAQRLKDIDRPERIYQLVADGLPSEFPPLRTARVEAPSPEPRSGGSGRGSGGCDRCRCGHPRDARRLGSLPAFAAPVDVDSVGIFTADTRASHRADRGRLVAERGGGRERLAVGRECRRQQRLAGEHGRDGSINWNPSYNRKSKFPHCKFLSALSPAKFKVHPRSARV